MIEIFTDFDDNLRMYSLPIPKESLGERFQHNCRITTRAEIRKKEDYLSIEIYWGHKPDMNEIRMMQNLKWIHLGTSGYDRLDLSYLERKCIMVTTSSEINAESVALTALTFVLQDLRGALFVAAPENIGQRSMREKRKGFDAKHPYADVASRKTIFTLGNGAIGSRFTKFARYLDFKVLALDSRGLIEFDQSDSSETRISRDSIHEFVARADYIVNCLPLTAETQNLIDRDFLRCSKSTLWYISVGRWTTTNELELVALIQERRIRGASLDVYSPEFAGLAPELLLNGSIATMPHVAGNHASYWENQIALFQYNLQCFLARSELRSRLI